MKVRDIFEDFVPTEQKTKTQLQHELNALIKAGPHPEGTAGHKKMKDLEKAIEKKGDKEEK